jgi:hypothetical protein
MGFLPGLCLEYFYVRKKCANRKLYLKSEPQAELRLGSELGKYFVGV